MLTGSPRINAVCPGGQVTKVALAEKKRAGKASKKAAGAARAARAYDRLADAQRSDAAAVSRLRLTWRMPVIPSLPSWHAYS